MAETSNYIKGLAKRIVENSYHDKSTNTLFVTNPGISAQLLKSLATKNNFKIGSTKSGEYISIPLSYKSNEFEDKYVSQFDAFLDTYTYFNRNYHTLLTAYKTFEQLYAEWLAPLLPSIDPTVPGFSFDPSFTFGPDLTLPNVDLRFVGPKKDNTQLAMEVQTDLRGMLYLRGKSYRDYNGKSWSAPTIQDDSLEVQGNFRQSSINNTAYNTLSIRTVSAHSIYYTAYYAPTWVKLQNGVFPNSGKETTYSFTVDPLRMDWETQYLHLHE